MTQEVIDAGNSPNQALELAFGNNLNFASTLPANFNSVSGNAEIINLGVTPNDGKGDKIRVAINKINNNFAKLSSIVNGGITTVSATEPMRTVFTKVNDNFTALFSAINVNLEVPLTQELINLGVLPNDGKGDSFRIAFTKINSNFSKIFSTVNSMSPTIMTLDTTSSTTTVQNILNIGQVIFNSTQIIEATPLFQDTSPSAVPYGAQEWINVGATPNDGTGDPLRVAFQKINNNFSNLFYVGTVTSSNYSVGNLPGQVVFETPVNTFTQASFQVRSSNTVGSDSQEITITAQISNDGANVKYTGYGTTFFGNALTRYSMDVLDGNVRLMVDPLVDDILLHFITAQVTYIGDSVNGINIGLNGYIDTVMTTENGIDITTENG